MLSAKIYLIVVSTMAVVNGKTVDKMVVETPTAYSQKSDCNDSIKSKKNRYKEDRKAKKKSGVYSYSYKSIKCKTKNVKLGQGDLAEEIITFKW